MTANPQPIPIFKNGVRIEPRLPMIKGNRYKVFLPGVDYTVSKSIRRFHEKIVEITAKSNSVNYVFVSIIDKQGNLTLTRTWIDPDWLFTIDPQGNCVCEVQKLMTSGCQCGGK
jgi:hypothetical protein